MTVQRCFIYNHILYNRNSWTALEWNRQIQSVSNILLLMKFCWIMICEAKSRRVYDDITGRTKEHQKNTKSQSYYIKKHWMYICCCLRYAGRTSPSSDFHIPPLMPGATTLCQEIRSPANHLRLKRKARPAKTKPPPPVSCTIKHPPIPCRNPETRSQQRTRDELTRLNSVWNCFHLV